MDRTPLLDVDVGHRLSRLDLDARLRLGSETLALVGPSGAGKTTVLRAIAGSFRPDRGRIAFGEETWLDAERGVSVPPERRRVGMVFQDGALFPHLSVAHNVGYGLRRRGADRGQARRRAGEVLDRFGIAHLAGARPGSLSGGERQRVALARAVASEPVVMLLDEGLGALDPATRARVGGELWTHLRDIGLPAILVSHDFADVVGLADRIAVMEQGRIVQVGTAAELLEAPSSQFVAALTGVNYFVGWASRREDVTEVRSDGAVFVSTDEATGPVGVVVYPWEVSISTTEPEGSARNALAGPVRRVAGVGNRVRVIVASSPPIVAEVTDGSVHRMHIEPGVRVVASWKATGTRLVPRPS
jgi:molybdate transport system ATP-binding protein